MLCIGGVISHPDGHRQIGRAGGRPDVPGGAVGISDGAGFASHRNARGGKCSGAAGAGCGLEHICEHVGGGGLYGAIIDDLGLIDDVPIGVLDSLDEVGFDSHPAVGQRRIGRAELCWGYAIGHGAQSQCEIIILPGQLKAELRCIAAHGVDANEVGQIYRGDVQ